MMPHQSGLSQEIKPPAAEAAQAHTLAANDQIFGARRGKPPNRCDTVGVDAACRFMVAVAVSGGAMGPQLFAPHLFLSWSQLNLKRRHLTRYCRGGCRCRLASSCGGGVLGCEVS
jgi:hypothetical protein